MSDPKGQGVVKGIAKDKTSLSTKQIDKGRKLLLHAAILEGLGWKDETRSDGRVAVQSGAKDRKSPTTTKPADTLSRAQH